MAEKKTISLELDKRLLDKADELADQLGEARTTVLRLALRIGLDELPVRLQLNKQT